MEPRIKRACEDIQRSADALVRSRRLALGRRGVAPAVIIDRTPQASPTTERRQAPVEPVAPPRAAPEINTDELQAVIATAQEKLQAEGALSPDEKRSLAGLLRQLVARLTFSPWRR